MRYIEEMIEELDKEIAMRLKPYQQQLKFRPPEVGEFRMSRCEAKKSLTLQELRRASVIPLLASGQGGVAERSIKCREASADREAGWFSDGLEKENHPGCVGFGGFAKFILMTQPPLLAVMQGG